MLPMSISILLGIAWWFLKWGFNRCLWGWLFGKVVWILVGGMRYRDIQWLPELPMIIHLTLRRYLFLVSLSCSPYLVSIQLRPIEHRLWWSTDGGLGRITRIHSLIGYWLTGCSYDGEHEHIQRTLAHWPTINKILRTHLPRSIPVRAHFPSGDYSSTNYHYYKCYRPKRYPRLPPRLHRTHRPLLSRLPPLVLSRLPRIRLWPTRVRTNGFSSHKQISG